MYLEYWHKNPLEDVSNIPEDLRNMPWLSSTVELLQNQARITQKQTEEISSLKELVQELKDEVVRLTKMPQRPKFRSGCGNPKERSEAPGSNAEDTKANSMHMMAPQKT